ncbi:hypothetical protein [Flavobacterium eburneipallidum]|uniref:hypothetical protein n=1 Tax=Flavobacterium eburneipallidum TaxID=3003263 RepID=UPI0022AC8B82|nr:hypothetical protein [Flavobacterium eburneipallidum]
MRNLIFLILFFSIWACKNDVEKTEIKKADKKIVSKPNSSKKLSYEEQLEKIKINKPKNSILSNDIQFINDSILEGKFKLDLSRYELENSKKECFPTIMKKEDFYEYTLEADKKTKKEFKNLGDLNGDGKNDFVFILPSLGWCEEGQSYYFTNNKIPRILTESNCCHIEGIFSIGDIDEDGGNEIAEFNSSCASNFKVFKIWTLKNDKWELVDDFLFFINNGKYDAFKDFNKMYKKISKNKFKFLEISDRRANGEIVIEWKSVTMK